MSAGTGAVADIVGADIAIIGAGGAVSDIAIIGGFVTDVVALRATAAGIARMDRAGPPAAGISAVAV